ncbi:MAG: type II toxin-antitoxin system RelE/ParE family toxin [Candidatus Asgardarchaeum sp.]
MYRVKVTKKFKESLEKIRNNTVKRRILEKVIELTDNPKNKGKLLKGYWRVKFCENIIEVRLWELRIGDWRVIFYINHEQKEVWLLYVNHRHRIFKRKSFFRIP